MSVPSLSDEQRREALRRAATVRAARGALREELKLRQIDLAEAMERASADDALCRMRVASLLEAIPGYGKKRVEMAMQELGISPARRLDGLGDRQRDRLTAWASSRA